MTTLSRFRPDIQLNVKGMKNLFGKPRPNLLARCQPDLDNIGAHVVGGWGQDISMRWTLVESSICTQTNMRILDDGFRSFPSGHSSFSWAGMLYLSLFLCSKFAIAIPFLPHNTTSHIAGVSGSENHQLLPMNSEGRYSTFSTEDPQDKRFDSRHSNMLDCHVLTLSTISLIHCIMRVLLLDSRSRFPGFQVVDWRRWWVG